MKYQVHTYISSTAVTHGFNLNILNVCRWTSKLSTSLEFQLQLYSVNLCACDCIYSYYSSPKPPIGISKCSFGRLSTTGASSLFLYYVCLFWWIKAIQSTSTRATIHTISLEERTSTNWPIFWPTISMNMPMHTKSFIYGKPTRFSCMYYF